MQTSALIGMHTCGNANTHSYLNVSRQHTCIQTCLEILMNDNEVFGLDTGVTYVARVQLPVSPCTRDGENMARGRSGRDADLKAQRLFPFVRVKPTVRVV